MDSLSGLNSRNHSGSGTTQHNEIQPYARRAERRMLLEQVAMAVLAAGLLLAIL